MQTLRMIILALVLGVGGVGVSSSAQTAIGQSDLDALYQQLDEALERSSVYESQRQQQIDTSR